MNAIFQENCQKCFWSWWRERIKQFLQVNLIPILPVKAQHFVFADIKIVTTPKCENVWNQCFLQKISTGIRVVTKRALL